MFTSPSKQALRLMTTVISRSSGLLSATGGFFGQTVRTISRRALAPAVAARLEDAYIVKERLIGGYEDLASVTDMVLVEGAGGLLVPIDEGYLMADLARDLGLSHCGCDAPGSRHYQPYRFDS